MNWELFEYFSAMRGCYAALPDEEKAHLLQWDREHVDGSGRFCTSDWPGWEKYIGPLPTCPAAEKSKAGYVYLLRSGDGGYKIGRAKVPSKRLSDLQSGNPEEIRLVHTFYSENAEAAEVCLHEKYSDRKIRNEWFDLTDDEVSAICSIGVTDGR